MLKFKEFLDQRILDEGVIDFIKRALGYSWGKRGDVVNGPTVIAYMAKNTYHGDSQLKQFRKSKFKLQDIDAATAKKYRSFTDKESGYDDDLIDPDKLDSARARKITYDSLIKYPPVLDADGFIWDGNHRIQRALELKLPKIPVLKEM